MWKTLVKWSLLSLLLAYVVVMFVWAQSQAANHKCTDIDVIINGPGTVSSLTQQSVIELLKEYPEPIVGQPLHSVNTLDITNFLKRYNNFENVECAITTMGNLKISVTPMIPAIRVFDGNSSYYVNKDGKTMSALPAFHADVPVVTGNFNSETRPEMVMPLVNYMKRDKVLADLVTMIYVQDSRNIILIPPIKGHVINFGDTTRLHEKKRAIITAYKSILPYKGWDTYDTISVKFKGQIVATRRDKTPRRPVPVIDDTEFMEERNLLATDSIERNSPPVQ